MTCLPICSTPSGRPLEEIEDSDLIVHVVDGSHPSFARRIAAVHRILDDLGYGSIPRLLVFNKIDRMDAETRAERLADHDAVGISALNGEGIDQMLEQIAEYLPDLLELPLSG